MKAAGSGGWSALDQKSGRATLVRCLWEAARLDSELAEETSRLALVVPSCLSPLL